MLEVPLTPTFCNMYSYKNIVLKILIFYKTVPGLKRLSRFGNCQSFNTSALSFWGIKNYPPFFARSAPVIPVLFRSLFSKGETNCRIKNLAYRLSALFQEAFPIQFSESCLIYLSCDILCDKECFDAGSCQLPTARFRQCHRRHSQTLTYLESEIS